MKIAVRACSNPFENRPPLAIKVQQYLEKHKNEVFDSAALAKEISSTPSSIKTNLDNYLREWFFVTSRKKKFYGHPEALKLFVKELRDRGIE